MTRRQWSLAASAVAVCLILLMARCVGHDSPISAPTMAAVKAYDAGAPDVQAQINAAWTEAEAARARTAKAEARAAALEVKAAKAGHRADSIAALAQSASTPAAAAQDWHDAYDARTAERDTLRIALDTTKVALSLAIHRGDTLTHALVLSDSLRKVAASLMHDVVREAKNRGCSVPGTFGLVGCPSRKVALVTGTVVGVAGVFAWNHRSAIRIP